MYDFWTQAAKWKTDSQFSNARRKSFLLLAVANKKASAKAKKERKKNSFYDARN